MNGLFQNNVNQNQFQNFNNQAQGNNNFNQNHQNIGFMPQMSPQQIQMMMNMQQQQFEMQKQQARQIGQLLRKQKELMEEMKKKEEERLRKKENEDNEIILFFNHNYDILPLTFKESTTVAEALSKYIEQSHKQNPKFKHEKEELKIDFSGKTLKEVDGLINGSEITVVC